MMIKKKKKIHIYVNVHTTYILKKKQFLREKPQK